MNYGIVNQKQLDNIDQLLKDNLIAAGVACAIMVDMAGNTIAKCDNGQTNYDVYSFAALAAGNYASVDAMAKLVGELEFSLLFHKGEKTNIHFSKVNDDFLLIATFGHDISLGFLRLKVAETIERINATCNANKKPVAKAAKKGT